MSRIMIAGTGSGCGKTTVTCAVLGALKAGGKPVVSFKDGPDYIDPMFHERITGVDSRNLDIFLMGEEAVRYALKKQSDKVSVIEGVMGLYDGIGSGSYGSANHLSLITNTPAVLVVNAKGKSQSVCAEIGGYLNYEENNLQGVILNGVSEALFPFYKGMIEDRLGIRVYGFMPNIPEAHIPSRHLGLVTAGEVTGFKNKIRLLSEAAEKYIALDELIAAGVREPINVSELTVERIGNPIIYAARDRAFCFYYEDNHELLRALGAELRFFSPLEQENFPEEAEGVLLWGGYPELYADKLQANISMRESLLKKIKGGMPVYAECGGFMYLQESLTDLEGRRYSMVGAIEGNAVMTKQLRNFGYVTLEAREDNLLCGKGAKIRAHSFHHSVSSNEGDSFMAVKESNSAAYPAIAARGNIFGGYPHIHFLGNIEPARSFLQACVRYGKEGRLNEPGGD